MGEFDVILADPPWEYDYRTALHPDHYVEKRYSTMNIEDIKNIKIPSGKNSVLFLWATATKLNDAFKLFPAWNFDYITCAVWHKYNGLGMGQYFRVDHELLLLGQRGHLKCPTPDNRFSSIFRAKKREHSHKPEMVYDMIEKMYPNTRKIELFARRRREGWAAWGNQVNDTIQTVLKSEIVPT